MTVKELSDKLSWHDEDTIEVYISYNNRNNGISAELDCLTYKSGTIVFNGFV